MTPKKALSIIKEASPIYWTQKKSGETVFKPDKQFEGAVKVIEDYITPIEVIEKELGIIGFLPVLFKALKEGAYFKNPYYKDNIRHFKNLTNTLEFDKNGFFIRMERFVNYGEYATGEACFFFKDYGKTWALTKEELS